MKKFLAVAVLALAAVPAMAQHHHGYHGGHRHGSWGWAPWIGGAIAGAVIYDVYNRPVVVQQPVIVQQPPVVYQSQPNCGPWVETQNQDGTITRTRTCTQ